MAPAVKTDGASVGEWFYRRPWEGTAGDRISWEFYFGTILRAAIVFREVGFGRRGVWEWIEAPAWGDRLYVDLKDAQNAVEAAFVEERLRTADG